MKYILSYGGGLNSTAMLVYIIKQGMPLDLVIFADTGNEFEHTYEMVEFYKKWSPVEFVIVTSKYGKSLYDYCYDKKITPSRMKRDCTSKFKITPIRNYIRNRWGKKEQFMMYVGIDSDESHRMKDSNVKYIINQYPLVDNKINRQGCVDLLKHEGLPIPKKSGCWFCPFTKKAGWLELMHTKPELFEKSIELEQNNKRYPELVSLLNSKPLIQLKLKQGARLTDYEPSCDVSAGCFL